jgi:hypothetical protein
LDESLEFASGTRRARAARLLAPLVPFRSSFIQLFLPFESSKRVSLYYPRSTLEQLQHARCKVKFSSLPGRKIVKTQVVACKLESKTT